MHAEIVTRRKDTAHPFLSVRCWSGTQCNSVPGGTIVIPPSSSADCVVAEVTAAENGLRVSEWSSSINVITCQEESG